ncbi:MAG TPA: hypothetical protein VJR29_05195 [bacterium]|nr:hypothetical protein [bacterium]
MALLRRNKLASILLSSWALFFFALPALIGFCRAEAKAMSGHDCCGAKVACHQQLQAQPCCETQGSAPPAASPWLSWAPATPFSLSALAQDFALSLAPAWSSAELRPPRSGIFLLKHSFLC